MDLFFNGFYPGDPEFYYFKKSGNRKLYYLKHNDKMVGLPSIRHSIVKNIKEYDKKYAYLDEYEEIRKLKIKNEKYLLFLTKYENYHQKIQTDIEKYVEICNFTENDFQFYYFIKNKNNKSYYKYYNYKSIEDCNYENEFFGKTFSNKPVQIKCKTSMIAEKIIISEIKEFDEKYLFLSKLSINSYLEKQISKYKGYLEKNNFFIQNMEEKIDKLDIVIINDESINKVRNKLKEDKDKFRNEYNKEKQKQKEKFESYFQREYNWYKKPENNKQNYKKTENNEQNYKKSSNNEKDCKKTPIDILKSYNIFDKKGWKDWLRINHPDRKIGNTEDCQKVITAGRNLGY